MDQLKSILIKLDNKVITIDQSYNLILKLFDNNNSLLLSEVKYRTTRFAHECRLRGVVTNNETANLYEELYEDNSQIKS